MNDRTFSTHSMPRRRLTLLLAALVAAGGAGLALRTAAAADEARVIPPFAGAAMAPRDATSEVAVLAGGCFWGVQGVFQHVEGVSSAVSGYAGGDRQGASYEAVGTGRTGHAEAVRVSFDPRAISYSRILQIYFSVAHDPTQLDRQGPDHGTQYRSAIFPTSAEQASVAKAYIAQLDKAKVFPTAIVTRIEPGRTFYPAEDYHQDFLVRNPTYPYIVHNDLPKIASLKQLFPTVFRSNPVLVGSPRKAV